MKRFFWYGVFLSALLLVTASPRPVLAENPSEATGQRIVIHPPPSQPQAASEGFSGGQRAYANGDYITAHKELLPLAVEGNPTAQYYIGRIYDPSNEDRIGVTYSTSTSESSDQTPIIQDYKQALRWYLKAAKQGHVPSMRQAGMFFKYGQLYRQAYKWLSRAAEAGDAEAQYQLGIMYHYGMGMPRDDAKAAKWLGLGGPNLSPYKQKQYGWTAGQGYGAPAQGRELIDILKDNSESGNEDSDALRANRVQTGTVSHRSEKDGETRAEEFERTIGSFF